MALTLPDTIALNDTALLNAMMKEGITIDDLLASGEYKFGRDDGAKYFKEAEAVSALAQPKPTKTKKPTSGADSMQGGLF